ncbi:hypothetical protein SAMN04515671_0160 [Nakamurella panacisegetis]|uniref:Uncharacterized protein n=1 Tax=Nakamurella panacisegetis TaxID=1090615 RepID=A0A1H0HPM8_9ACTN|nr:hypothetical protein [Nakamurella panacisegetis]SDO21165.1 hypothetical protein SAMN04515671_0160 [Nakamurella panacisegetis]
MAVPDSTTPDPDLPVTACARCGTTAAGPPLSWMFEMDRRRGGVWFCDRCARENLRSVEAKLNQEWW